jgi:hypothetical protein
MRSSILLLILAGCGGIVGDGKITSESRTVSDAFHSVSINSGFAATVSVGPTAITVKTDENLLSFVETFVQGDTLVVRVKPDTVISSSTLDVTVSNGAVEGVDAAGGSIVTATATSIPTFQLNASGGSQLTATGVSSSDVDIDASGGSQITASGTASNAKATSSGGSEVELTGVSLNTLTVEASGASTIDAAVSTAVNGTASGGSIVTITGTAQLHVDSSGGSKVTGG